MSDIPKMSLLEKITQIKIEIHKKEIHPTGQNDFAKKGLTYYKLEDFIGIVDSLLLQYRVFADIEYDVEYAFLELINIDNEEQRLVKKFYNVDVEDNSFKNNKKANLIQRVNSIQTYQKRYLYMNTFNIGNTEILDFEDEAKDPQNSEELISHHAEMMKKHSFQSSEKIDENKEKLEKELNTIREEQSKKEKREGQVITGEISKKKQNEKTAVEMAIEDSEKRAKENEGFKKGNEVKKTDLIDDPGAKQFIKDISLDIKSNNPSLIKAEIAKRQLDRDSGITEKEAIRAIKELKRNGVPK